MKRVRSRFAFLALLALGLSAYADSGKQEKSDSKFVRENTVTPAVEAEELQFNPSSPLTLEQCIAIALESSHRRKVSALAVEIAESQHRQALSAYWPQLQLGAVLTRVDESPDFLFPEEKADYTIEGLGPAPIVTHVTVPDKDVKLMDRDNLSSTLSLTWPLYTGGLRPALVRQARAGIEADRQAARRTDLEVVYDVRRMYTGVVLADGLYDIGRDTLARLEATLELTENLYRHGSGEVKKTDFLRNKTVVESVRAILATLESNREISRAALVNTMGLSWQTDFDLAEKEIPCPQFNADLSQMVSDAYQFNPDWSRLLAGLEVARAGVRKEKSARWPQVALTGTLWRIDNPYDAGIVTDRNEEGWSLGVGLQMPLFTGFLTTHRIREASARLKKMREEQILLRQGIALQIKHAFILMNGARKRQAAGAAAVDSAEENRQLNIRAYHEELVETREVIEAQLMESIVKAGYQKARYDQAVAGFQLDFLVGREIHDRCVGAVADAND